MYSNIYAKVFENDKEVLDLIEESEYANGGAIDFCDLDNSCQIFGGISSILIVMSFIGFLFSGSGSTKTFLGVFLLFLLSYA